MCACVLGKCVCVCVGGGVRVGGWGGGRVRVCVSVGESGKVCVWGEGGGLHQCVPDQEIKHRSES